MYSFAGEFGSKLCAGSLIHGPADHAVTASNAVATAGVEAHFLIGGRYPVPTIDDPSAPLFTDSGSTAKAALASPKSEFGIRLSMRPEQWRNHVEKVRSEGGSFLFTDDRHRRRDGSMFSVEMWVTHKTFENRDYHLVVVRDITERKQAEQQQQLVALVENSSDFIGIASLEAKVLYINPAGRHIVGLNGSAEVERATIADFHPEATYVELRDAILPSVLKTGRWEGELQLRHIKTGDPIDVEARIFAVKSPSDGRVLCLATAMQDIRRRKRLEGDLPQSG